MEHLLSFCYNQKFILSTFITMNTKCLCHIIGRLKFMYITVTLEDFFALFT